MLIVFFFLRTSLFVPNEKMFSESLSYTKKPLNFINLKCYKRHLTISFTISINQRNTKNVTYNWSIGGQIVHWFVLQNPSIWLATNRSLIASSKICGQFFCHQSIESSKNLHSTIRGVKYTDMVNKPTIFIERSSNTWLICTTHCEQTNRLPQP